MNPLILPLAAGLAKGLGWNGINPYIGLPLGLFFASLGLFVASKALVEVGKI